ncbi:MAG: CvpA family protein [Crocinitomicaceae bacterium]|nr:CvpA family protein [Crocinitomicaceae bacterium]MDG1659628.1 CvpA family protein [Crocinitomicaceae bacterium]
MNFLDIFIISAIGFGAWKGFSKGLVIEVFSFVAFFLGLWAGIHFSDGVAEVLKDSLSNDSEYLPAISFTVIFLIVGGLVYFAGKTFEKLVKIARLSLLNRIGGTVFGAAKWVLIVGGVVIISESYDDKTDILSEESKQSSLLFTPVRDLTMGAIPAFTKSTIFMKNALDNKELLPIKVDEVTD